LTFLIMNGSDSKSKQFRVMQAPLDPTQLDTRR